MLSIKTIAKETGLDLMTLRLIAESGKVPFLGAIKRGGRNHYCVERQGYEAYQRGEISLDIGNILKEIQREINTEKNKK